MKGFHEFEKSLIKYKKFKYEIKSANNMFFNEQQFVYYLLRYKNKVIFVGDLLINNKKINNVQKLAVQLLQNDIVKQYNFAENEIKLELYIIPMQQVNIDKIKEMNQIWNEVGILLTERQNKIKSRTLLENIKNLSVNFVIEHYKGLLLFLFFYYTAYILFAIVEFGVPIQAILTNNDEILYLSAFILSVILFLFLMTFILYGIFILLLKILYELSFFFVIKIFFNLFSNNIKNFFLVMYLKKTYVSHIRFLSVTKVTFTFLFIIVFLTLSFIPFGTLLTDINYKLKLYKPFIVFQIYNEYIGYPKYGIINKKEKIIVGYNRNYIYAYDLETLKSNIKNDVSKKVIYCSNKKYIEDEYRLKDTKGFSEGYPQRLFYEFLNINNGVNSIYIELYNTNTNVDYKSYTKFLKTFKEYTDAICNNDNEY